MSAMTLTPCPGVFDEGNVFAVLGKASRCLKRAGRKADVAGMMADATSAGEYATAIGVVMNYVEDPDLDEFGREFDDDAELEVDEEECCDDY